jgi:hypothetical protein
MHGEALLSRIQLDDELFVDDRLHLFAGRDVRDFAAEGVAIDREPIRHGSDLGEIEIPEHELPRLRFIFDRDFVACFHVVGSDIHAAPIHEYVAVRHQLSSRTPRIREPEAVNDVVQSCFEKLQKRFARNAAFAQRVLENAPELPLKKSILITQFLFFPERNRVFGLFAPRTSRAMHAGRIVFPLQRLGGAKDRHAITATHFRFWSGVSTHGFVEALKR